MIRTRLGTQYGQGFPLTLVEYVDLITLDDSEIRTLQSVPVEAIPAPGENKIIAPMYFTMIMKVGSVPFSGTPIPVLAIPASADTMRIELTLQDPSVTAVFSGPPYLLTTTVDQFNYLTNGGLNAGLFITSLADVAGGNGAKLSFIITYQIIDLAGLI